MPIDRSVELAKLAASGDGVQGLQFGEYYGVYQGLIVVGPYYDYWECAEEWARWIRESAARATAREEEAEAQDG